VAQLAGSVGEQSAYHHGEASLMGTIINLAQDFVGSNNISLLQPIGQFGTRLAGGKDHASPRYIFTMMSPLTKLIFNPSDGPLLKYIQDDNQRVEPEWYMPIIPMVLVNGADGIGTGWMTKIPNYNPREIVKNLKRMLEGKEPKTMNPWYKNFKGQIEKLEEQKYCISGEINEISDTKVEITELPIRGWTQPYKENTMEPMLNGSEKVPAQINDYKEYHTDKTVKFVVSMNADKMRAAEQTKGLHSFFKLHTTISTSSMVLFDKNGCMKKYNDACEILKDFYELRFEYYGKRKQYLEGMLEAESLRLSNQARFILEKCDGSLTIENKKKKIMITELQRKNFDPDPVKKWKAVQEKLENASLDTQPDSDEDSDAEENAKDADYDYLLGMAMWCLTQEKIDALLKTKGDKHTELKKLQKKSPSDLWNDDLDEFLIELDKWEAKELEDAVVTTGKASKGKGKKNLKLETAPSPAGIRVDPRIPDELRNKAKAAVAAKGRKESKVAKKLEKEIVVDDDEFDGMVNDKEKRKSLGERVGFTPEKKTKQKAAGSQKSSPKGSPTKKEKGGKKKNPWETSSDEDESMDENGIVSDSDEASDLESAPPPKKKTAPARAATKKVVTNDDNGFNSDEFDDMVEPKQESSRSSPAAMKKESESDSEFEASPPPKKKAKTAPAPKAKAVVKKNDNGYKSDEDEFDAMVKKPTPVKKAEISDDDNDSDFGAPPPKKDGNGFKASDSDSDFMEKDSPPPKAKKEPKKAPKKKLQNYGGDSDDEDGFGAKPAKKAKKAAAPKPKAPPKAKAPAKKAPAKKAAATFDSDVSDVAGSDEDDDFGASPKKAKGGTPKKGKKSAGSESDEASFDLSNIEPARDRPGRQKKAVNYQNFDDESDEDF